MDTTMRMGSSTQASASSSYSLQSRGMLTGYRQCRPAVHSPACRQHLERRNTQICSFHSGISGAAVKIGGSQQRSGSRCKMLAVTRAGAVGASHELCASIQYKQLPGVQQLVNAALGDVSEGLETPVQLLYLVTLLGFLVVGAYLVVRQVLVRRELEEAAKVLGERIRTNDASPEDCFELGVILLRKKLYTQATKNLEKASRMWDAEPEELAQVHNALGFAYFNMDRSELALKNYRKAVELQPGYTTAWNNLGDAYEKAKDWDQAMKAYEETLAYSPDNKVARNRVDSLRNKVSLAR